MAKRTDMQQHELNGKTILLVGVPRNAVKWNPLHIIYGRYGMSISWWGKARFHHPLPEGNWKFFATTDNITEQQAAELVEETDHTKGLYVDYTGDGSGFVAPSDSLRSWLFVNGFSGNQAVLIKG